jgi:hypothetical protein
MTVGAPPPLTKELVVHKQQATRIVLCEIGENDLGWWWRHSDSEDEPHGPFVSQEAARANFEAQLPPGARFIEEIELPDETVH